MLELPLTAKIVPIAIAGMIALTPISPDNTVKVLDAAKQKIITVIHKEGYTTTIDQNGEQIQLPYKEKVTVEKQDDTKKRGFISRTISGTITGTLDICKDIYWWVKK